MLVPNEAAIDRAVVYRRDGDGPPISGVITTVAPRRVFVRLGGKPCSVAVSPVALDFAEPQTPS
jgi:hypothetical protein